MEPTISLGPAAANAVAALTNGLVTPPKKASPAKSPSKSSPGKRSPVKESPVNELSGPSTPRTLESDSVESEADVREQSQALAVMAEQRDGLAKDLKVCCFLHDALICLHSIHQCTSSGAYLEYIGKC